MDINELIKNITEEVYSKIKEQEVLPAAGKNEFVPFYLNQYIDYTVVQPDVSLEEVREACYEAKKHKFNSVCVNPNYVEFVAEQLSGSVVIPCSTVGFPLGAITPEMKADEAQAVFLLGAKEIEMVVNIAAIKSNNWHLVLRDIESVVRIARGRGLVKVILESSLLTDEEIVRVCSIAKEAKAAFVQTSTGFCGDATVADVALMRKVLGGDIGIKASSGIVDYKTAVSMIDAGATRIGSSSGVAIVSAC